MSKALPQLHLIAGNGDAPEPSMHFIEIKHGIATAVNNTMVAQMNLSYYSGLSDDVILKLNGKKIHRDIWEQILDAVEIDVDGDALHYERGGAHADFDISCDFNFPDYANVVNVLVNGRADARRNVAINPDWLILAKKLFGSGTVGMRFYEENNLILIFPIEPPGAPRAFIGVTPFDNIASDGAVDLQLINQ